MMELYLDQTFQWVHQAIARKFTSSVTPRQLQKEKSIIMARLCVKRRLSKRLRPAVKSLKGLLLIIINILQSQNWLQLPKYHIIMIDGLCIMHSNSTYMFHHFFNETFNDGQGIGQRLNIIRLKINKQQNLKKKIEKDQIVLYQGFGFLKQGLNCSSEAMGMSGDAGQSSQGKDNTLEQQRRLMNQKLKNIDNLPREGIIFLRSPSHLEYFGGKPKMIFWREFRCIVVALIGGCEDINLANQSVYVTFILKEIHNLWLEENALTQKKESSSSLFNFNSDNEEDDTLSPSCGGYEDYTATAEKDAFYERLDQAEEGGIGQCWTGLPKEEKMLELISKMGLKEYASGLLPFYTIDFFKHKVKFPQEL